MGTTWHGKASMIVVIRFSFLNLEGFRKYSNGADSARGSKQRRSRYFHTGGTLAHRKYYRDRWTMICWLLDIITPIHAPARHCIEKCANACRVRRQDVPHSEMGTVATPSIIWSLRSSNRNCSVIAALFFASGWTFSRPQASADTTGNQPVFLSRSNKKWIWEGRHLFVDIVGKAFQHLRKSVWIKLSPEIFSIGMGTHKLIFWRRVE